MILHTVNKSPYSNSSLNDCIRRCSDSDSILLIEDGVYACQRDADFSDSLANNSHISFYALEADIRARGLVGKLHKAVQVIDDCTFVDLCIRHKSVQSWF